MPALLRMTVRWRNQLSIVSFRRTNLTIRPQRLDSSFNRLDPEIQREGKTCQTNGQISHPGARSKPAKKTAPQQTTPKSRLLPADKPLSQPPGTIIRNRTRIPPHSPKPPPIRIQSQTARGSFSQCTTSTALQEFSLHEWVTAFAKWRTCSQAIISAASPTK